VANNSTIRSQITEQIITALEGNLLPWRRPWAKSKNSSRAANVVSKRAYSGINPLILELHRLKHGLGSRWYGTFAQWQQLGCEVSKRPEHVEKGQWGARIMFYSPLKKTRIDKDTGEAHEDRFFMMRTFVVFSADQVVGADKWQSKIEDCQDSVPDFQPAEELIAATGADIRHLGEDAFYSPTFDYIQVPLKNKFNPIGSYYETVFHELGHWSEPEHRVGCVSDHAGYAMNELVAEMSSSFLATELGVPQGESMNNHAAYLKHWLEAMKGDTSFIFKASTQASKVTDFLLNFVAKEVVENEQAIVI